MESEALKSDISADIERNKKFAFEGLDPEIQSAIEQLRQFPDNLITKYIERCLEITGRAQKLVELNNFMSQEFDLGIEAFRALRDIEEQEIAVKNIQDFLSQYTSEEEKREAKKSLEKILG